MNVQKEKGGYNLFRHNILAVNLKELQILYILFQFGKTEATIIKNGATRPLFLKANASIIIYSISHARPSCGGRQILLKF